MGLHASSRFERRTAEWLCIALCLATWFPAAANAVPTEEWRQILSVPRIGARFTTVTVDRRNPSNLYIGTENSTIFVSSDGGRLWDERMLNPRQVQLRSTGSLRVPFMGPRVRPPVMLGNDFQTAELHLSLPDPFTDVTSAGAISVGGFLGITQQASPLSVALIPYREDVLALALDPRNEEQVPVVRIEVCHGSVFDLFVATTREVFGSPDGRNFYRVYAMNPGSVLIDGPGVHAVTDVDCAPHDPNIVVVSTALGPSISYDGGFTFSDDVPGAPGGAITQAAYDLPGAEGGAEAALLVGAEAYLYAGQLQSGALQWIYPDPDDTNTLPHTSIRSIVTTDRGEIWLATDFGPRASFDDGNSFSFPGNSIFWGQPISQVDYASYGRGVERVIVVRDESVWATEDSGKTWSSMFTGLTRRTVKHTQHVRLASGEVKWWVVTAGEVWESVTSDSPMPHRAANARLQQDAEEHLRAMTPLDVTQDEYLTNLHLDVPSIESLLRRQRYSALFPTLDLTTFWDSNVTTSRALQMISFPISRDVRQNIAGFGVYLQATWHLPETVYIDQTRSRSSLYRLRDQMIFVAEDAWHEKWLLLDRLRRGIDDPVEAEILSERIEVLDAVLDSIRL